MSPTGEWIPEQREPGWLARVIAPQGAGRPATLAFLLGVLAAVAFVGSLALDWQSVTFPTSVVVPGEGLGDQHVASGIASIEMLSLVYTLGVVALLAAAGAVITRPELALRLRMAMAGATVGLLGVVVAMTVKLADSIVGLPVGLYDDNRGEASAKIALESGVFCAYAGVLLCAAAVWVAGRPAARALAGARGDPASERATDAADGASPVGSCTDGWAGGVGEISVQPSQPLRLPPG